VTTSAYADAAIRTGVAHRALQRIEVLVYDYDALAVDTTALKKGELFQPWPAAPHWRGVRVPITFGVDARAFDWGSHAPRGHFVRWDDFFERCAAVDAHDASPRSRIHEQWRASPFDELAAIASRLRASARSAGDLTAIDAILARLAVLQTNHADAVGSEWAAMGFDNMDSARRYAREADDVLEEARALLQKARDVALR
jgi:hypothetical protein